MNREEFLRGLENALSGNVPPSVVRDNLRYYDDYIRSERQKGRSESDIMDELGDPRLIARTILDTTPGAAEGEYEEYHPFGSFAGNSGRTSQQGGAAAGPVWQLRRNRKYPLLQSEQVVLEASGCCGRDLVFYTGAGPL